MLVDSQIRPDVPSIWRLTAAGTNSVVLMNDGDLIYNIYCVHSVTSDVGGLTQFAQCFGTMRLHGIQIPKREMTQHLGSSIEALATRHVATLKAFQPEGPVHLIGWSAGAIVALEMAQQLRSSQRDVPLLVALDGAPCNTGAGLSRQDPRYLYRMITNLPRWIRDDLSSDWSFAGVKKRLSEKLAGSRGVSEKRLRNIETIDAGAVERVITREGWSPAQKAFVHSIYQSMARYVPKPYDGRVLVFETETQPLTHLRQVGASWRAICEAPDIVRVAGNHSGLISEERAAALSREVIRRIAL